MSDLEDQLRLDPSDGLSNAALDEIEHLSAVNAELVKVLQSALSYLEADENTLSGILEEIRAAIAMSDLTITTLRNELDHLRALEFATRDEAERFRALNAELVKALQALVKYDRNPADYSEDHGTKLLQRADAAIVKAKGGI